MFDQLQNYLTLLFAAPSILFNRSKDCFYYNKLNLLETLQLSVLLQL